MSLRKLFAAFVALALLLVPAMPRAGAASAAVPGQHMQMMDGAPCKMPPSSPSEQDRMAGSGCCVSMCAAVAVAPDAPAAEHRPGHVMAGFPAPKSFLGHLSEIATPPPRLA